MKALFYGVGIATLAGLMCGGAMRYAGRISENPEGPQMLVSAPSARDVNPTESTAFAGYNGQVPEYVVGTDWLQPVSFVMAYEDTAYSPPAAEAIREAAQETPVTAPPPEQTAATYPSVDGDILAGMGGASASAASPFARQSNGNLDSLDAMNARIADDDYAASERIARPPS